MSDPSLIPEGAGDLAKLGSASGIGSLLTLLIGRLFRGQDKQSELILTEVKSLAAAVTLLSQQFAVMASGTSRRDGDVERLEAAVAEQGKAIARLEAIVEQLSEGVAR